MRYADHCDVVLVGHCGCGVDGRLPAPEHMWTTPLAGSWKIPAWKSARQRGTTGGDSGRMEGGDRQRKHGPKTGTRELAGRPVLLAESPHRAARPTAPPSPTAVALALEGPESGWVPAPNRTGFTAMFT